MITHTQIQEKAYFLWLEGYSDNPETNYYKAEELLLKEEELKNLIIEKNKKRVEKEKDLELKNKIRKSIEIYDIRFYNKYSKSIKNIIIKHFILQTIHE